MPCGNAAVPLVTVIALSYANLLEGSVLTETVFAWPGLGHYLTNSLQNADMNAVLGGTLVIGAVFVGLNLLSDLLYSPARPAGPEGRMTAMTRREWLLSDRPASRRQARAGQVYRTWLAFRANWLAMVGLGIVLRPHPRGDLRRRDRALRPGDRRRSADRAVPAAVRRDLFGTDDLARDIFSRIVHGARLTLMVVVLVAVIAAPDRPPGRHHRRLFRRLGRYRPDARSPTSSSPSRA